MFGQIRGILKDGTVLGAGGFTALVLFHCFALLFGSLLLIFFGGHFFGQAFLHFRFLLQGFQASICFGIVAALWVLAQVAVVGEQGVFALGLGPVGVFDAVGLLF